MRLLRRSYNARSIRGGPYTAGGGGGAPDVTSLGTSSGTEIGGTSVTINGTGFTGATAVTFNGVNATSFTVNTDILITATAPAYTSALSSTAADNAVDVVVTTPGGSDTLTDSYTYTSQAKALAGSTYWNEWRLNDPRITVTSGDVETLPCFNGNGNMTQATAGSRPDYDATGLNGGPAARTAGVHRWLQSAFSSTIAIGKRPYVFIVLQINSGSAAWWCMQDTTGATFIEMQRGPSGTWRFYLQPSAFSATTDLGADSNTNVMLVEGGFNAGGTNSFVVEGTGGNNGRTGTIGTAITHFTMFAEYNGAAVGNSTSGIAYALVLNGEPGSTLKSDIRTFLLGANFPGYTSNKMHP